VRGTLGEYVAYKSYIVRKREPTPRPETQNKIKMILIHILPPCPHSEKHTLLSLGVHRQRPRAQWPAVHSREGGRGAQRGRQEGEQKRKAGKKKNSDITVDALSLTNCPPGIKSQCSAAQEDHTMKGISCQESPALWNCLPNHSIFRIRKGRRTISDHPHYPIKEIHDNQPIGLISL
jgi:hypothetical protein